MAVLKKQILISCHLQIDKQINNIKEDLRIKAAICRCF